MFNAIESRTVTYPWSGYYGGLYNPTIGNATGAPVQDWMSEPTSASGARKDTNGNVWYHARMPTGTSTETFSVSDSGTVSQISGENFGASVSLDLDGVSTGSFGGSWGYSLTTSQSNSYQVSWSIPGPVSQEQYFTVACSGTTASGEGLVVHVWQDSGPA